MPRRLPVPGTAELHNREGTFRRNIARLHIDQCGFGNLNRISKTTPITGFAFHKNLI